MMQLLFNAVKLRIIRRFEVDLFDQTLFITFYGYNADFKNWTKRVEEIEKEANEFEQSNIELALSQYVTQLLEEFQK